MTLWEWLDGQRKEALAQSERRPYVEQRKYWQGYAAALQDVQNYVE